MKTTPTPLRSEEGAVLAVRAAHEDYAWSVLPVYGPIMRRLRQQVESEMTNEFCPGLSIRLDLCLALEQSVVEEGRP